MHNRFSDEGFLSLANLPHPSLLKDMDRATERIALAIERGEKIILIGDYDVDGVVSTTIMKLFFDEINISLDWIIPNRFRDGYGLSPTLISQIEGYDLVVTVDNGISAVKAAQMCRDMGIDLIITDHHLLPPVIPEAYAIIDQKQAECDFPYEEICGAQIAWYLIASLKNRLKVDVNIKSYLEFVAIAIIADMMPLKHINRAMVIAGLELHITSISASIRAFKEHFDKERFSAEDIGFWIAPILNSAGRMEDASSSVRFLCSKNIYEARSELLKLVEFNIQRREIEQKITNLALLQVNHQDDVLLVYGEDWHEGVLGIVAARVSQHYQKPTILLSQSSQGDFKGSGRSFGVCDLFDVTSQCRGYLHKFGGHQAAIGLSLPRENLSLFREKLQESYRSKGYQNSSFDSDIVGEIDFSEINFDLVALMKRYEPYGQENKRPKFITHKVKILQADSMGKGGEHLRFAFEQSSLILTGVKFKTTEVFYGGEIATLTYTINENNFRNKTSLQLLIETISNIE